ncbi:MAG: transposase [Pontiellaceae bacterium]|nr:transposase [Pontiellaceae bacterium]
MKYDPSIHRRRSIRLKGHDYAGGGEYFVTVCAHREFIAAAGGRPFAAHREILLEEWGKCGEIRTGVHAGECVVMPDHFHGLVRIEPGASELGRVVGAFKAAVSMRIRRGDPLVARTPEMRIWHRNYYEKIVRSAEERARIAEYIRLNPVRLIFHLNGMAAFGNPNLWELKKVGVLASGSEVFPVPALHEGWCWISGFHSATEELVPAEADAPCIRVAAVRPEGVGLSYAETRRLAEGRLLVVCPFDETRTTRENALARNRLVADGCDKLWIPAARPGGSLEKLRQEFPQKLLS